jgi:hypothetical protein
MHRLLQSARVGSDPILPKEERAVFESPCPALSPEEGRPCRLLDTRAGAHRRPRDRAHRGSPIALADQSRGPCPLGGRAGAA